MRESPPVERRIVSVLFADLVGFTALSEALDAEEVAVVQDHYFAAVRAAIERHGGRLEKFIGDAAMAVFGVPRARDDDAERAVRSGLALVHAVGDLAGRIDLGDAALELRVGINTGEVAYAQADSGPAGEWRVSGDPVNVAARLQTAAEPGTVLLGEVTALAVADSIVLAPPVTLQLKGKSDSVQAWPAVSVLPERSRERAMGRLRAPLLGRDTELARLAGVLQRVRDGANETLLVIAPPGVGKSRLVEELLSGAGNDEAEEVVVRRARLGPEVLSPAAAVAQLLLSAPTPAEEPLEAELAALLAPPDARSPEATALSAAALADERRLLFRAWVEGLDRLAGGRPQVWLLEDLHWAGPDLLAFVEAAAAQPAPGGRLVLGTGRPALLDGLADRPAQASGLPVLDLSPLDEAAAGKLVRALVGEALPADLAAALVERSDGNALFIEELLRSWVSVGLLQPADEGGWRLMRGIDGVALPQTVQAIYAAQLDDLPAAARTLLRRASVAGRHVPRSSLEALDLRQREEAVESALRRALLQEGPPHVVVGRALSYRHALLRDAGYASLARAERARLHARLAAWYEEVAGERANEVAEVIARHYAAAADHSSRLEPSIADGLDAARARRLAADWFERAADRALAGAAHETARQFLAAALQMSGPAETVVRARLLLRLGEVTAYTADMDEGGRYLGEALQLYRDAFSAPPPDLAEGALEKLRQGYGRAAAALGRVWVQQLRFDDAEALAQATLEAIGEAEDPAVARLLAVRGWVRSTLTMDPATIDDLDRALRIARAAGDRRLELDIVEWRAAARGEVGLFDPADWAELESLATELGDGSRAVRALRAQASVLVDDRHAEVWPLADRAEDVARRRGGEEDVAWVDYLRAETGFVSGDWRAAMNCGLRAVELGERYAYHRVVVRTWHVLLPIAEARGERDLISRAAAWYAEREGTFPDSPYARIMEG
ncbi:MAG TPA: adenylate/guanylate cyclase domain-containing protein, partial [Candidatus Limnocylindria bacterium]|nr:adenylate/guanylate cyclase domain-containing protein [Candidatus Limnocylindria bacterium]